MDVHCFLCEQFITSFFIHSDRPFSIFQNVRDTQRNIPKDWDYFNIDQMNAPDLYQGMLCSMYQTGAYDIKLHF